MAFFQEPPRLANPFVEDPILGDFLAREVPASQHDGLVQTLRELGELSVEYYGKSLADRANEPVLTQWDAWGNRVDHIEVSPLWRDAQALAARHGLVATGYDPSLGPAARLHQFAAVTVLGPSLDVYSCPLAMTDGAARTLADSGNRELMDRYLPRLLSRDPLTMWTSGQWMTERTGGSDVSISETVARRDGDGWRLFGTKWFTSATTSQIALTLARPEGNPEGSRGLALFCVELRDENGRLRGITVNRLKDKLGTRKVPTAELTLDGTPAVPLGALGEGVRAITPMLSVTRTWNAIAAVGLMRRGLSLARDFARRRRAFGALLIDKPLHADTLASLEAEYAGALLLSFRAVQLLGLAEHGALSPEEAHLARALTPIAKLTSGKQAVAVTSEAIECCGGAGYVEDTGLPRVLADAQVLPIWEGTTNVLSVDTLRALGKGGALDAVRAEVATNLGLARDAGLAAPRRVAEAALEHALSFCAHAMGTPVTLEAGARRLALTLGRTLELSYLCRHAQWCLDTGRGGRAAAAARRFAHNGVDLIGERVAQDLEDTRLLA
ncbi:MAG: acyl-CoA dehydrogenase family protein [Myxococcales bacterium]|nr:acyl-CoA dehydrogenase family protein [Myxococcales bacterium]